MKPLPQVEIAPGVARRPAAPAWWLGLLWGFGEGTVFFIVPDVLLGWTSLQGVKPGLKTLGAILVGSLLAGASLYTWAARQPQLSRAVIASVPFVRPRMFEQVQAAYRLHGLVGMLEGPGSGIPYKVYAVLAPPIGGPFTFLWLSLPARLERLALSWALFTALGWFFRRSIGHRPRLVAALFGLFWIGVYALYWSRI